MLSARANREAPARGHDAVHYWQPRPAPAGTPGMSSCCTCTGHDETDEQPAPAPHVGPRQSRAAQAVPAPFPVRGGRLGGSKRQRHCGRHGLAPCRGARGEIDRAPAVPVTRRARRPGGSKPCACQSRATAPHFLYSAARRRHRSQAAGSRQQQPGSRSDRRLAPALAAAVRAETPTATRRGRVRVPAGTPTARVAWLVPAAWEAYVNVPWLAGILYRPYCGSRSLVGETMAGRRQAQPSLA